MRKIVVIIKHLFSLMFFLFADDSSADLLYSSQSMASISTVNSMGEIFSDKTPLIAKNKRYVSKSVYDHSE